MLLFGYAATAALAIALIWLIYAIVRGRRSISSALEGRINKQSLLALVLILGFFLTFSLIYMHPTEELYFDENIYQGIALNILHNGNALWCQYGSAYAASCPASEIYHDPIGLSFFIAIAFAVFGIGINTSYNLELFIGALSVLFTFLLASIMFKDKKAAVASTLVFALMPELFIWSRTQAVPNLIFMALTTLTFFLFLVVRKRNDIYTLSAFFASLAITSYMRLEGILLIPIFALLYLIMQDQGNTNIIKRLQSSIHAFNYDVDLLIVFFIFLVLIAPEAYFVSYQLSNPQFGQSSALFSLSIFQSNVFGANNAYGACNVYGYVLGPNICYFIGKFNSTSYFPTMFPQFTTLLSLVGIAILAFRSVRRNGEMYNALLLLLLWVIVYYLFYGLFYAGSVTYGVDVRFMLQITPPLALLAGICVSELGNGSATLLFSRRIKRHGRRGGVLSEAFAYSICTLIIIALVIFPFYQNSQLVSLPAPQQPQQSVISTVMTFFYSNVQAVPSNCLVFSYTPDIWFEANKSSAQIGDIGTSDSNFTSFASRYSCFVIDVGYWCNVPPEQSTHCLEMVHNYKIKPIVSQNTTVTGGQVDLGFYQILNYSK